MSNEKIFWGDLSYGELYAVWAAKYNFGAEGELTPQEAREIHNKWKRLGSQAKAGIL